MADPEPVLKERIVPKASKAPVEAGPAHVSAASFSVFYGSNEAVKKVTFDMPSKLVTAIIGPSGCGKSTFLRAINRMNDLIPGCRANGKLVFDGQEIYSPQVE